MSAFLASLWRDIQAAQCKWVSEPACMQLAALRVMLPVRLTSHRWHLLQDKEWAERKGRLGSAAGERPWPGATAIALLVHAGRLHVANAGDCRAVLCRDVSSLSLAPS